MRGCASPISAWTPPDPRMCPLDVQVRLLKLSVRAPILLQRPLERWLRPRDGRARLIMGRSSHRERRLAVPEGRGAERGGASAHRLSAARSRGGKDAVWEGAGSPSLCAPATPLRATIASVGLAAEAEGSGLQAQRARCNFHCHGTVPLEILGAQEAAPSLIRSPALPGAIQLLEPSSWRKPSS